MPPSLPRADEDAGARRRRWWLGLAWATWIGSALVWVATAPSLALAAGGLLSTLAKVVCGTVIVGRGRGDERRIGWQLAWPGALLLLFYPIGLYDPTRDPLVTFPGVDYLLAFQTLVLMVQIEIVFRYPTGRLRTRVDRMLSRSWVALNVGAVIAGLVAIWRGIEVSGAVVGVAITGGMAVTFLVLIVVRLRAYRGLPRVQQLQMKWFLVALSGLASYPLILSLETSEATFQLLSGIADSVLPVAIMVAITRYRLYDVERLISRTVGYAVVAGVLAALYLGGVALVSSIVPAQDRVVVAVTTVLVVAAFDPVRRRVTAVVDRRFDRTRYEADRVVAAFSRAVRDETDSGAVRARLHEVLALTLTPASVAVWEPIAARTTQRSRRPR